MIRSLPGGEQFVPIIPLSTPIQNQQNPTVLVKDVCLDGDGASNMAFVRRSQVQRQVLALYKELLRAAEVKSPGFKDVIRNEFKKNSVDIQNSDTMRIEYMVRNGRRRLNMMKAGFRHAHLGDK